MTAKPGNVRWLVFAIPVRQLYFLRVTRHRLDRGAKHCANAMGVVNALLVPWFGGTFGWTVAIALSAGSAVLGAVLLLLVRADRPLPA